jgi:hypothetical protein
MLNTQDLGFPYIEPIREEESRPFWSVVIPVYNRVHYLEQSLKSVLEQYTGPEDMEIQVIDDCSTEVDVDEIVDRVGRGVVGCHRLSTRVGLPAIFNVCLNRSRGHVVHLLHEDDYVRVGFYQHLRVAFESNKSIGMAFCRCAHVDCSGAHLRYSDLERPTAGIVDDFVKRIMILNSVMFPMVAVRRSTYEALGGFMEQLPHTSDYEMWVRIAAHYPVWFEPEVLACYRVHTSSLTRLHEQSAMDIGDSLKAIEIFESYLPSEIAKMGCSKARAAHALMAADTIRRYIDDKNLAVAQKQFLKALKCIQSPRDAFFVGRFIVARKFGAFLKKR